MTRRDAIRLLGGTPLAMAAADRRPTKFQLACMTLPYAAFPSGTRARPEFATPDTTTWRGARRTRTLPDVRIR